MSETIPPQIQQVMSGMAEAHQNGYPSVFVLRGIALTHIMGILQDSGKITPEQAENYFDRAFSPGRGDPKVWEEWWKQLKSGDGKGEKEKVAVLLIQSRFLGLTDTEGIESVNPVLEGLAGKYGLPKNPTALDVVTLEPQAAPRVDTKPASQAGIEDQRPELSPDDLERRQQWIKSAGGFSNALERFKGMLTDPASDTARVAQGGIDLLMSFPPGHEEFRAQAVAQYGGHEAAIKLFIDQATSGSDLPTRAKYKKILGDAYGINIDDEENSGGPAAGATPPPDAPPPAPTGNSTPTPTQPTAETDKPTRRGWFHNPFSRKPTSGERTTDGRKVLIDQHNARVRTGHPPSLTNSARPPK